MSTNRRIGLFKQIEVYLYYRILLSHQKEQTIDRNTNRMNVKIMRDCTINFMSLEDIC